ncbi:amidase family protein [Aliiroseovarius sp. KMU-50]|uniref:Amidase family protein n=1 Tax=Aliiroseovarius salicola TaxID=3009082 RepID=A0ABT4VZC5_9RHOB|nr:amidase family protein [Aliiroseovarius sp. KMU-50]MDA5092883.1 amidase family protein [Aliiroseovarius sp. KMU-50]
MSTAWLKMSVGDLGRGIGAGEIDPVELVVTYYDAIRTHPFADRIYARLTEKRALAEAEAARARAKAGLRLGLVDGVPISWKDLFDTAGVATESGSALLKGRVPTEDAQVLKNATAQGMVCLGKTHMSELAFSGLGLNPITATSPCVNDHDAVSGGSSSGAATSVAFDLAPCGIGSDTGGSVRIPSAWNDLVGLKTTSGRVSLKGVVPLVKSFDTVGPLCRTVEDAALMLAALEGGTPVDLKGATLKGTRLLVLEDGVEPARNEPRAGFESAIGRLMDNGAQITRAHLPVVEEALALSGVLFTTEAYATWQDEIEAQPGLMFPEILERFQSGKRFTGVEFVRAWQALERMRAEFHAQTAGFDAVVLPTSTIMPPNVERLLTDSAYYVEENLWALRNTRIGNLMGSSGLTLPTGLPSTGIMFLGEPMAEERLLRLGAAAEEALG